MRHLYLSWFPSMKNWTLDSSPALTVGTHSSQELLQFRIFSSIRTKFRFSFCPSPLFLFKNKNKINLKPCHHSAPLVHAELAQSPVFMYISFLQFTIPRMKTAFKLPHTSILRGHLSSPIIVKPKERKTESGKMDSELNFLCQLRSGQGRGSNSTELQTLVSYTMTAHQRLQESTFLWWLQRHDSGQLIWEFPGFVLLVLCIPHALICPAGSE